MVRYGWLWSTTTCNKSDWVWLTLVHYNLKQKWLGMVGHGWLWSTTTCNKSDLVWLALVCYNLKQKWSGLVGFGPLQPETKVIRLKVVYTYASVEYGILVIFDNPLKVLHSSGGKSGFFWCSQISLAFHKSTTSHRFNHWPLWVMASFLFLVIAESLPLSLSLSCFLFWPSSFSSHDICSFCQISSSFHHISSSCCHVYFLEAWLELVMTACEVTHFVYFICKVFLHFK